MGAPVQTYQAYRLNADQIFGLLRDVGFSPDRAATFTAIALAESGGQVRAHNTSGEDSRGLFQINVAANTAYAGWNLFDPYENAKAAFQVSQGGANYSWWSVTHTSNGTRYAAFADQANAAARRAGYNVTGDYRGVSGYGTQPTTVSTAPAPSSSGGGTSMSMAGTPGSGLAPWQLPPDVQVVKVADRWHFALVPLGPGQQGYLDLGEDLSRWGNPPISRSLTQEQWNETGGVKMGDGAVLDAIAREHGTWQNAWQYTLNLWGPNPAKDDPEIRNLLAVRIGRPDMSDDEWSQLLGQTDWYQRRTQRELEWNDLSQAEQQQQIQQWAVELRTAWFQQVGSVIPLDHAAVLAWAQEIASGKATFGQVLEEWIKPNALVNPESPWSRTLRNEAENQLQRGVDVENKQTDLRTLAHQWGVQADDTFLSDWATRISSNKASDEDFLEHLKDTAQVLYPWKERDVATETAATPWLMAYRRLYETGDATLFTPDIARAMQQGQSLYDFEKQLRAQPRWLETQNAKEELTSAAAHIGRQMGFE